MNLKLAIDSFASPGPTNESLLPISDDNDVTLESDSLVALSNQLRQNIIDEERIRNDLSSKLFVLPDKKEGLQTAIEECRMSLASSSQEIESLRNELCLPTSDAEAIQNILDGLRKKGKTKLEFLQENLE